MAHCGGGNLAFHAGHRLVGCGAVLHQRLGMDGRGTFLLDGTQFTPQADCMNWSLVTGATGGLGAAVATRLASEGRSLIVSGRDANRLESIANELRETHGVEVRGIEADLATQDGLDALRSITEPLDLVVVCGAAYHYGSFMELGDAEFERLTVCNVQNTGRLIRWAIEPLP